MTDFDIADFDIAKDKAVEDLLDEFDFEKVHKVMTFLDWEWARIGVPSIADLRKTARRLLHDLGNDTKWISAGGLVAYWHGSRFSLAFHVSEKEVFLEDYV